MTYIGQLLHRLCHLFGWQTVVIESDWDGLDLYIGARCTVCGKLSGWHRSKITRSPYPSETSNNEDRPGVVVPPILVR